MRGREDLPQCCDDLPLSSLSSALLSLLIFSLIPTRACSDVLSSFCMCDLSGVTVSEADVFHFHLLQNTSADIFYRLIEPREGLQQLPVPEVG